jgi:hypothetical protein
VQKYIITISSSTCFRNKCKQAFSGGQLSFFIGKRIFFTRSDPAKSVEKGDGIAVSL